MYIKTIITRGEGAGGQGVGESSHTTCEVYKQQRQTFRNYAALILSSFLLNLELRSHEKMQQKNLNHFLEVLVYFSLSDFRSSSNIHPPNCGGMWPSLALWVFSNPAVAG
jgi:hypothetical protein